MTVRRRSRRQATHVPIEQLNKRCKLCCIRYTLVITFGVALMTYFVSYEQPNISVRHPVLNKSDLTIMSYNVRSSGIDTKQTTQWKARRKVALEMITVYNPDVIGLQEPKRNQLEAFKQMGYESYGKLTATSILYNRDKFIMMDGGTLWLSQTPDVEHSTSWDISQERVVTWILITTRDASPDATQCEPDADAPQCEIQTPDHAYLVFNTHLDHKGEISRMESCAVIKDMIHNISSIKYENKYPVFLTGDFNEAKYSNVWQCLTDNQDDSFTLQDALHAAEYFGLNRKLKLQYTDHNFRGLQMNTWYMRAAQYIYFGFSHSVVKWFRNIWFDGVCCAAPSLYRQFYRRMQYKHRAGIHHLDWILHSNHAMIDRVRYFEVVSYHHTIDGDKQPPLIWSLEGVLYDRIVSKTIYPSDHFPILAAFNLTFN